MSEISGIHQFPMRWMLPTYQHLIVQILGWKWLAEGVSVSSHIHIMEPPILG